jgi:hypothetical protein
MAYIEKVCEYSDDYEGLAMYSYKRNLIQIMPKYRKLFRGQDAVLHVFAEDPDFECTIGRRDYALVVPSMQGHVNGVYLNDTKSIRQTKKRLKRMLRCRDLKTLYHNCSYWEWKCANYAN